MIDFEKGLTSADAHWNNAVPLHSVQHLWALGYTIVPRTVYADPFHVDPSIIPKDRAYQWVHEAHDWPIYQGSGWSPVTYDRHPGIFGPVHWCGAIKLRGLMLVDKPKAEVEAKHRANQAKAQQNVDDWVTRQTSDGFSVFVKNDHGVETPEDKPNAVQTAIPADLLPHLSIIMRERDRLISDWTKDFAHPPSPVIKARLTQLAIDQMRRRLGGPQMVSSTDQPEKGAHDHATRQENDPAHPAGTGNAPGTAGIDPGFASADAPEPDRSRD